MLGIEPADVRYLSYDELQKYGLKWVDPIEQETLDLQDAQSLGLDRGEYIRRQALQNSKCNAEPSGFDPLQKQLGHRPSLDEIEACLQRVMKFGE